MKVKSQYRAGFTAIEILIVVAIIALLMSIAAGALFRARAGFERTATETTLTKLASMVDRHWKAVIEAAKKDYDGLPTPIKQNLIALADNKPVVAASNPRRDDRARLLYVKFRLKQAFPTSFNTALFPGTIDKTNTVYYLTPTAVSPIVRPNNWLFTGSPAYVKACYDAPTDGPKTDLAIEKQSSMLLLMALEQAQSGVASESLEQSIGTSFVKQEGNYRYLVDTWGNPLRFFIFPMNDSQMLTDLVRKPNDKDPQDPEDLLRQSPNWRNVDFPNLLHPYAVNQKLVPTVVSAGPDGQMGLYESAEFATGGPYMQPVPANPTGTAALPGSLIKRYAEDRFDNIYSFRLRQSGARGD